MRGPQSVESIVPEASAEAIGTAILGPSARTLQQLRSVYLFGARKLGRAAKVHCERVGIAVAGFLDNDPALSGTRLDGVPVLPPAALAECAEQIPVIICSIPHQASMENQLRELDVAPTYFYPQLSIADPAGFPSFEIFAGLTQDLASHREHYRAMHAALHDEASRRCLRNILRYRMSFDTAHLTAVRSAAQRHYFEPDVIGLGDAEVFVDGGGYDGDTTEAFIRACGGTFDQVFLFEPDSNLLTRARHRLRAHAPAVRFVEKALYRDQGVLRFRSGDLDGTIAADGDVSIEATSIDHALDRPATFIKLDVEGAEEAAIEGARQQIEQHTPKLAVSAYHRPDHLWKLWKMLATMVPGGYRYFLRHYSDSSIDTVLYAVPAYDTGGGRDDR